MCSVALIVLLFMILDKFSDLLLDNVVICSLYIASPSHNFPSLTFPPFNTVWRNLIRVAASWAAGVWTFANQKSGLCDKHVVIGGALKLEFWLGSKLPQTII